MSHPAVETTAIRPVVRRRLMDLLDCGAARGLAAVVAPAGWGKTALVSAWARERDAPLLTLRPEHADAWAFERDLRAALAEAPADPAAIVLDDLQHLSGPGLCALESLLRAPGPPLVVASRAEPRLGLPRRRLAGALLEVRARELAFDDAEAAALLESLGVVLGADERALLLERTEGWAAAIRLIAASLSRAEDRPRLLEALADSDGAIADYLTDEVLAGLDDDTRSFVFRTCAVDELCAELAAELTGHDDCGAVLEQLVHGGVPLDAVDRDPLWYRWHPLFAELVRARTAMHDRTLGPRLHARAARWLAANGRPAVAIGHASAAGADAAPLLAEHWLELLGDGCHERLSVTDDDRLRVCAAAADLAAGDVAAARSGLSALRGDPAEATRLGRLLLARAQEDVVAARRAATEALRPEPSDALLRALVMFHLGLAEFSLGTTAAAEDRLNEAAVLAQGRGRSALLVACSARLAALAIARGRAADALGAAAAALGLMRARRSLVDPASLAWARAAQAAVALWDGDELEADRLGNLAATQAFRARDHRAADAVRALRAHVCALSGDEAGARSLTRIAREAGAEPDSLLARWMLALGPTPWAPDPAGGFVADVTRAMSELRSGDDRAALARAASVTAAGGGHPVVRLHALVVEAVARDRAGVDGATDAIKHALEVAERTGCRLPFARPLPGVAEVLEKADRLTVEGTVAPGATRVAGGPLTETLTPRERAVLRLLGTFLTTQEIAAELHISPNTAKTHVRAVYRKLAVGTRRAAVDRGRELQLL